MALSIGREPLNFFRLLSGTILALHVIGFWLRHARGVLHEHREYRHQSGEHLLANPFGNVVGHLDGFLDPRFVAVRCRVSVIGNISHDIQLRQCDQRPIPAGDTKPRPTRRVVAQPAGPANCLRRRRRLGADQRSTSVDVRGLERSDNARLHRGI